MTLDRRAFLRSLALAGVVTSVPVSFARPSASRPADGDPLRLLQAAVDAALSRGATFADARYVLLRNHSIQVRREDVYAITDSESAGIALRVFHRGNWGNAASSASVIASPTVLADTACALAAAAAKNGTIEFSSNGRIRSARKTWSTPVKKDPFSVPLQDRVAFLKMLLAEPARETRIAYAVANLFLVRRDALYVNSLNGISEQTQYTTWPNFGVTAFDSATGRIDSRSGALEAIATGWEITDEYPFRDDVRKAIEDVLTMQSAPALPTGEYDLLVSPSSLWRIATDTLLPHLDGYSLLGLDGGMPSAKLFTVGDIGHPLFDSSQLTVGVDGALRHGLATCAYDDAGHAAPRTDLLRDGVLSGFVGSDELPPAHAVASFARAGSWETLPRAAFPNVVIAPKAGGKTLPDMIADVENGVLLVGRGRTQLSGDRKWFRAGAQTGWRIEKGKLTHMVRDFQIDSSVRFFWSVVTDTGGPQNVMTAGELFPGNASPLWDSPFSVSVPPMRFHDVAVVSTQEGERK